MLKEYENDNGKVVVISEIPDEKLRGIYKYTQSMVRIHNKLIKKPDVVASSASDNLNFYTEIRDSLRAELVKRKLLLK